MNLGNEILPCDLGRIEYDGARYCYAHGGFRHAGSKAPWCDRLPELRQAQRKANHRNLP